MLYLRHKHHLTLSVLPLVGLIAILKYLAIALEWQLLPLSGLVTAAVSADVFLLGFLIAGSLPDYKEAERLPSEIAANLDALADECLILRTTKPGQPESRECLERLLQLTRHVQVWFHKQLSTREIMREVRELNTWFAAFEPLTQANFIVRLKQEQQLLRRSILRVRTIREVSFVATAYAIGELFSIFVIAMLVLTNMDGVFRGIFFTTGLSFLILYMIALVKDLDNPFHYHKEQGKGDEVDVGPLKAVEQKIEEELR